MLIGTAVYRQVTAAVVLLKIDNKYNDIIIDGENRLNLKIIGICLSICSIKRLMELIFCSFSAP